jgi:hypothetical protein
MQQQLNPAQQTRMETAETLTAYQIARAVELLEKKIFPRGQPTK